MNPSPSPAARVYGPQSGPQPIRALPQLTVPRPLPGLPQPASESDSNLARKASTGSMGTVRLAQGIPFRPSVSKSTTAVSFPNMDRTNSSKNSPGVTFSQPSTVSAFALSGLRKREQEHLRRVSSATYSNYDSESTGTGTSNSQMQLLDHPRFPADPEFRHERGGMLARNRPIGKTVTMSSRDSGVERQPNAHGDFLPWALDAYFL